MTTLAKQPFASPLSHLNNLSSLQNPQLPTQVPPLPPISQPLTVSNIFLGKKIKPNYLNIRNAIDQNDTKAIIEVLSEKPQLLTRSKPNSNLLKHACLSGKNDIVNVMLKIGMQQSTKQLKQSKFIENEKLLSDTFVECIRFEKPDMVKLFVEAGFNLETSITQKKQMELYSIDFAVLGGHYQIAQYIYSKLSNQARALKPISQYEKIAKKYGYRYVNYEMFVQGLINNTNPCQMGNYLKKQLSRKEKIKVWRIHNEGCWDWLLRIVFGRISKKELQRQDEFTNIKQRWNIDKQVNYLKKQKQSRSTLGQTEGTERTMFNKNQEQSQTTKM